MNGICDNDFYILHVQAIQQKHNTVTYIPRLTCISWYADSKNRRIAARSSALWRLIGNVSVDKAITNIGQASSCSYEITVSPWCMCDNIKFNCDSCSDKRRSQNVRQRFAKEFWESAARGFSANCNARIEKTRIGCNALSRDCGIRWRDAWRDVYNVMTNDH